MEKRTLIILLGILGVVLIFLGILAATLFSNNENNEGEKENIITSTFVRELTPLELSENKEQYLGKKIRVMNAYIASEAFIYIQETQDRIYLKPANKEYCRRFNVEGTLSLNEVNDRWELLVSDFGECLSKT